LRAMMRCHSVPNLKQSKHLCAKHSACGEHSRAVMPGEPTPKEGKGSEGPSSPQFHGRLPRNGPANRSSKTLPRANLGLPPKPLWRVVWW
jgi:hypothetical protein